ncbi:MAG: carboxypeptidase-like regulatory domain-containing protein [Bacteroidota bacterium]
MTKVFILILLLVLVGNTSRSQSVLGQITESGTNQPVQFANVYFANTTIGTTTNPDGTFKLSEFPSGKYDLTVSFVGYNTYSRSFELSENETLKVAIELVPEVVNLPEVFITADTSNWKRNFQSFRNYFLGTTPASTKTQIINKKALTFYDDYNQRTLYAHAREPLVIGNDWLGYEITYDMISFQMEYRAGKLAYYGVPRFSYLKPKNKSKGKRWERNRNKAYKGSLLHFFRSMAEGNFEKDKFVVFELLKIPNPDRLPDNLIEERISYYQKGVKTASGGSVTISVGSANVLNGSDSLSYYLKERRKPKEVDSLGRQFKTGKELLEGDYVNFIGMLQIIYKGAKEALEYPFKSRSTPGYQESRLHIKDRLKLYDNGYYEDVRSTYVEGYWSWVGTMASLLPMDYVPPNAKTE